MEDIEDSIINDVDEKDIDKDGAYLTFVEKPFIILKKSLIQSLNLISKNKKSI